MLVITVCLLPLANASLLQVDAGGSIKPDPDYTPVPGKTPEQLNPLLATARSLSEVGRLSEAEQSVHQFLKTNSESADAHYLLGFILFRQARAKDSLTEYTEGARYRTPNAFDLKVVACDYVLLKDYMDADKWFTRSVEWDSKDWQGWYYLGRTKYNENRFEEAVNAFNECLKLNPTNVKAEDNLGLSYAGLGRNDEAKAAYLKAMTWEKNGYEKDPGPFVDLGGLLIEDNQVKEAIPYLLEAAQLGPQDIRVHRGLGKAYLRLNQTQDAERELNKAIALAPQDASLHYMLGQVYRKQGLSDKANVEFAQYAAMSKADASRATPAR